MKLQLSFITWVIFSATGLVWAASGILMKRNTQGSIFDIKQCFTSLFGYAWIAFFIDYIVRFILIVYDPILLRRTSFPLWLLPEETISWTWAYSLIFWCLFCSGYVLVSLGLPTRVPRVLQRLDLLAHFHIDKIKVLDAIVAITLIASIWVNHPGIPIPRSLLTPMGRLSTMYVIPLTIVWGLYYIGKPIKMRCLIYMLPGIITYLLSPYREHLIVLFLCWLVPAIVVGQAFSNRKLLVAFGVLLILCTLFTSAYRDIKWKEVKPKEERPTWVLISNRFHGFDSMVLTVYSVPHIFSYSERPVIMGLIYQIVPRLFFPSKKEVRHPLTFSTTIWALTESHRVLEREPAMIAPSISGDLYSINGPSALILGAFIWGAIVGFLERWIRALGPFGRSVLLVMFGLVVAAGMEKDFVNASASIIHLAVVALLLSVLLPFRPLRSLRQT